MHGAQIISPFIPHFRGNTEKQILPDFSLCIYIIGIHIYMYIYRRINVITILLCSEACFAAFLLPAPRPIPYIFTISYHTCLYEIRKPLTGSRVPFPLVFLSSRTCMGGGGGSRGSGFRGCAFSSLPESGVGWGEGPTVEREGRQWLQKPRGENGRGGGLLRRR